MGDLAANIQVGQPYGTFEQLKAKLESMATSKRDDFNKKIIKTEERTSYLDINGDVIGSVLVGTEFRYGGGGILPPKKEDIKNNGLIEIGKVAYFVPIIRDGKGGQVDHITIATPRGMIYIYDKDGDGIIGEDEIIKKEK